jgi:hypothetical protein
MFDPRRRRMVHQERLLSDLGVRAGTRQDAHARADSYQLITGQSLAPHSLRHARDVHGGLGVPPKIQMSGWARDRL